MGKTLTRGRAVVLAMLVCTGLGAGGVVAVQAAASGGTPSIPTAPKPGVKPARPSLRPMTATGSVSPQVLATNVHCGQVLIASVTMNGDLFCSGPGLILNKNSITLNLNGHAIVGPGGNFDTGVEVNATSDIVENGVIAGFYNGVIVNGTTDTVTKIRATYNKNLGIADLGSKTKLTTNVAYSNVVGFVVAGTGSAVSGNHAVSNTGNGFNVVSGTGIILTSNVANGNGGYGVYDGAFVTTLTGTSANFNVYDGIYVNDASAIDGGTNTAKGNDYGAGATPEQCFNIVCA